MKFSRKKQSKPNWVPVKHQKEGVKRLVSNACQALFWKPGLRKTSTILAAVKILKKKKLVNRVLVIAPKRVARFVWKEEVEKWADFEGLTVDILLGTEAQRDKIAQNTTADILTISCDVQYLDWFFFKNQYHKKLGVDMLVVDESSKFKNGTATRFKGYPKKKDPTTGKPIHRFPGLKSYISFFRRRIIATGSPRPKDIQNLFTQIFILDEGKHLGRYISHFRNRFMNSGGFGGYTYTPRPGAVEEINKLIEPLVHVVGDEALSDLPDITPLKIEVELPPKVRAIYNEIEDEFITEIESGIVKAANSGVASGKCRQVANGALYYQEYEDLGHGLKVPRGKRKYEILHNEKIEALKDLVEEMDGEQLFIGYEFAHDKEIIQNNIPGIKFLGESDKEDEKIKEAWDSGELQILGGHPAGVGHGLNLQNSGAFNIALYGLTWDYENLSQFIRRIRRSGNENARVYIWMILAANTVDELVYENLISKEEGEESLYNSLSSYIIERRGGGSLSTTTPENDIMSRLSQKSITENQSLKMLAGEIKKRVKSKDLNPSNVYSYIFGWIKADCSFRNPKMSSSKVASLAKEKTEKFITDNSKLLNPLMRKLKMKTSVTKKTPAKTKAPAAKKKVAPKKAPAAKKKVVVKATASKSTYTDKQKIKLVQKNNPKRKGSASHDRYEYYKKAKTVGAYLDAGGTLADLKHDAQKGFIEVK